MKVTKHKHLKPALITQISCLIVGRYDIKILCIVIYINLAKVFTMESGLTYTPDMLNTCVTLPILWGDMDAYGHVNNVVYLRWFEEARVKML